MLVSISSTFMRMVNWLSIQLFGNSEQFKRRARDRSAVM